MFLRKRIKQSAALRGLAAWLVAQYVRLVYFTGRWRVVGGEIPAAYWDGDRPFILALWHGRILMSPCSWRRGTAMSVLVSHHRDGEIISGAIRRLGIGAVRGSSGRTGASALRAVFKILRSGQSVAITPDGPRGPRMRADPGIIAIARASGVPIVPMAWAASRRRVLGSWDGFVLALPFSRGVFAWGEPIMVARDLDDAAQEAKRSELEAALNAITDTAERLVGAVAATAPGPVAQDQGGR